MAKIQKTQLLEVYRTLANGEKVLVGELAENRQGIFFAYSAGYLANYPNLSPFKLAQITEPQQANNSVHEGLFGVFADSLPDGWGMLLQDRFFEAHSLNLYQISPLDRLAFVGNSGIGALSYQPTTHYPTEPQEKSLFELGQNAQQIFEGQTDEVLQALIRAGSSGGARPKAQIFMPKDNAQICRTTPRQNDEAWIVKFTTQSLPLQHEEGLLEAVYLTMAEQAGLQPVEWQLLEQQNFHWLAVKRFDYLTETAGGVHTHSLCGLLDATHRSPSIDYFGLLKATKVLCKSRSASQLQFRRAMFNLFGLNQDDHTKNWAFVQDEQGDWQPSLAYDVTYSPLRHGEHSMGFRQYGKAPSLKVIQELAEVAGFDNWQQAQQVIDEVVDTLANFSQIASDYPISQPTKVKIQKHLNQVWQENKGLL
ncbi:phosphatidylinositol kinase [Pasteurellaceae bacterium 15-036681]|nr:phosphatidylinositol kinase [Pasteurellaceae bacterium 15-036681]